MPSIFTNVNSLFSANLYTCCRDNDLRFEKLVTVSSLFIFKILFFFCFYITFVT